MITELEKQKTFMRWLVSSNEYALPHPWSLDEENETLMKLFSAVVFFRIRITDIDAKFKLNQNKSKEDRQSVIDQLSQSNSPFERKVAELMEENTNDK
jgi:transcriptional regulator